MIAITLALAAAAATSGTPAQPTDPLDRVRCEREDVTGSLVQSRKVCHTMREWKRIRADANSEARRVIEQGQRMNSPG